MVNHVLVYIYIFFSSDRWKGVDRQTQLWTLVYSVASRQLFSQMFSTFMARLGSN